MKTTEPSHRNFRLTRDSAWPDPPPVANVAPATFRDAMVFTLIQQILLLFLAAMLLDGGLFFQRVAIASVVFWILTPAVMVRRGGSMANTDILLVKWSYLPLLLATCIFWSVASEIPF